MSTEVKQEGDFKIKKRTPKKLAGNEDIIKVDLSKPPVEPKKEETKDAVQEPSTEKVDVYESSGDGKEVGKGNAEEQTTSEKTEEEAVEDSPIQIIEDEENSFEEKGVDRSDEVAAAASEQKEILQEAKAQELPEGVDKLIKFMEETGGTVQDYARLNADYSNVDNNTLLREYYKQNKPHLDAEDVDLLLEDFTWDEEIDDDKDIRKKKIAYKEEVAKAKNFLEQTKSKYYEEIKLRPGVTQEQQKAMDFFNRYNEEQKRNEAVREGFINTTKNYFSNDFKGFDFKLGDKKVRYGVKDPNSIAESQKDLTDFVGTFLDKNGQMKDPAGYHKAIYAARNADTMATHFYEQGRADAIKEQVAKTKNITTEPRQTVPGDVFVNGLKVKAISGLDSSKLKIRTKKFNT
jgi:hypothetical protein